MGKIVQIRVPAEYAGIAKNALINFAENNNLKVEFFDIIPEKQVEGTKTITYIVSDQNSVLDRIKFHNFAKNDLKGICFDSNGSGGFYVNQGFIPVKGGVNEYAK